MGWASGFQAGTSMAGKWIDTYNDAGTRRDLAALDEERKKGLSRQATTDELNKANAETAASDADIASKMGLSADEAKQYAVGPRDSGMVAGLNPMSNQDYMSRKAAIYNKYGNHQLADQLDQRAYQMGRDAESDRRWGITDARAAGEHQQSMAKGQYDLDRLKVEKDYTDARSAIFADPNTDYRDPKVMMAALQLDMQYGKIDPAEAQFKMAKLRQLDQEGTYGAVKYAFSTGDVSKAVEMFNASGSEKVKHATMGVAVNPNRVDPYTGKPVSAKEKFIDVVSADGSSHRIWERDFNNTADEWAKTLGTMSHYRAADSADMVKARNSGLGAGNGSSGKGNLKLVSWKDDKGNVQTGYVGFEHVGKRLVAYDPTNGNDISAADPRFKALISGVAANAKPSYTPEGIKALIEAEVISKDQGATLLGIPGKYDNLDGVFGQTAAPVSGAGKHGVKPKSDTEKYMERHRAWIEERDRLDKNVADARERVNHWARRDPNEAARWKKILDEATAKRNALE